MFVTRRSFPTGFTLGTTAPPLTSVPGFPIRSGPVEIRPAPVRMVRYALGSFPTLRRLCVALVQANIDSLAYVGDIPYEIMQPILECCTWQQLKRFEEDNPVLAAETNMLWKTVRTRWCATSCASVFIVMYSYV